MPTLQKQLVAQVARLFPDGVFYKETNQRMVALTIDDVPTPADPDDQSTRKILDAIALHNRSLAPGWPPVRATFFIITGHLTADSRIIERIKAAGHEIANHGIADETTALLHPEIFHWQMREAHNRITRHTNQPIRWYRPGRGLYNQRMVQTLRQFPGYEPRFALASMVPMDTLQPTSDIRFTAWHVSQFVFPGAILVLHGGSILRAENTAAVLPLILRNLAQRHWQVVTLSELWDKG